MDAIFERFLTEARTEIVKTAVGELLRHSGSPDLREAITRETQRLLRDDPEVRTAIKDRLLRLIDPSEARVTTETIARAAARIGTATKHRPGDYYPAVVALCRLVGVEPPPKLDPPESGGGVG